MADAVRAASTLVSDARLVTRVHTTGATAKLSSAASESTSEPESEEKEKEDDADTNEQGRPELAKLVHAAAHSGATRVAIVGALSLALPFIFPRVDLKIR
jgi:hypothetical protein